MGLMDTKETGYELVTYYRNGKLIKERRRIINFYAESISSQRIDSLTNIQIDHLVDPTYIVNEIVYLYKH